MDEQKQGVKDREPNIEDSFLNLQKIKSIVSDAEDRLDQIHRIIDKDIYSGIDPRVRDVADEPIPSLRFGMYDLTEELKKRLYGICDSLGSLKFKLREKP